MKKLIAITLSILFFLSSNSFAEEKLTIEKQLVGIVGATSGTVKTETRELKPGDKVYLNETIYAGAGSGTQILLLDQSVNNACTQKDLQEISNNVSKKVYSYLKN